jgi:hypothetical protein
MSERKFLVRYLREFPVVSKDGKIVGRGRPIGCVAAIDENHIGYTVCNDADNFNREHARNLAIGRAFTGISGKVPNRVVDEYFDAIKNRLVKVTLQELLATTISDLKYKAQVFFNKEPVRG